MAIRRFLPAALVALTSCGGDGPPAANLEPELRSVPEAPTYTQHVAAILDANCVVCHRAGQFAPFSLDDYATASRRARHSG